ELPEAADGGDGVVRGPAGLVEAVESEWAGGGANVGELVDAEVVRDLLDLHGWKKRGRKTRDSKPSPTQSEPTRVSGPTNRRRKRFSPRRHLIHTASAGEDKRAWRIISTLTFV